MVQNFRVHNQIIKFSLTILFQSYLPVWLRNQSISAGLEPVSAILKNYA